LTEEADEERKRLWEAQEKIIQIMQDAIADGILTKTERADIDNAVKELRKIVEGDGVITEEEQEVLEKVDKTFNLVLRIEKDFVSTYWKTRRK
jgi:Holliday junction resolvase RusA-like endonuclease